MTRAEMIAGLQGAAKRINTAKCEGCGEVCLECPDYDVLVVLGEVVHTLSCTMPDTPAPSADVFEEARYRARGSWVYLEQHRIVEGRNPQDAQQMTDLLNAHANEATTLRADALEAAEYERVAEEELTALREQVEQERAVVRVLAQEHEERTFAGGKARLPDVTGEWAAERWEAWARESAALTDREG